VSGGRPFHVGSGAIQPELCVVIRERISIFGKLPVRRQEAEIKTIDDAITDCTEKMRQETLSERKSKLLAGTSKS